MRQTFSLFVSDRIWGATEIELFSALADYLSTLRMPVSIVRAPAFGLRSWLGGRASPCAIHDGYAFLQHQATGVFWLLDCQDAVGWRKDDLRRVARDPRCRAILKQQYQRKSFARGSPKKVRPWIYTASAPSALESHIARWRGAPRWKRPLYFRGATSQAGRHLILEALKRHRIVADDTDVVPFDRYAEEMSSHQLALALPGWGNLCHREVEAFGMGTPVLMPHLKNELYNPLVPDCHYLSAGQFAKNAAADEITGQIARRYYEVIDDAALLDRVRRQAAAWYDANARFPNSLALTVRLLGLRP